MTKYCLNELEEFYNSLREEGIIYKSKFVFSSNFYEGTKEYSSREFGAKKKEFGAERYDGEFDKY